MTKVANSQQKISHIVQKAKKSMETAGGLQSVYFVGCGGSWSASHLATCLLERENTSKWVIGHPISKEFVLAPPHTVGKRSIVIVTSMKATKESVEALQLAKDRGAFTIAITGFDDSEMAQTADEYVVYTHSENWTCAFHNPAVALRISYEILNQFEGYSLYQKAIQAIDSTNEIFEQEAKKFKPNAIKFGMDYKDSELFHVFSCGTMFGAGYTAAYCHLIEMQQRNAIPINCGEYFHGAFEATTPDQPSILFIGRGPTRSMDLRVKKFLEQFCQNLTIIDSADFQFGQIDEQIADYIAPLIMSPLFRMYVEEMANVRNHPMTKRRYMWRFDY